MLLRLTNDKRYMMSPVHDSYVDCWRDGEAMALNILHERRYSYYSVADMDGEWYLLCCDITHSLGPSASAPSSLIFFNRSDFVCLFRLLSNLILAE